MARITRDKAILSFLAQSGQRDSVLSALRFGHVRDQLEKRVNPIIVHLTGELLDYSGRNVNKIRHNYDFAIGKECAMFLRLMMRERIAEGEQVNDSSWLFRSYAPSEVKDGKRLVIRVKHDVEGKAMSTAAIRFRVVNIAGKTGVDRTRPGTAIRGKKVLRHDIYPHMFRRWWKFRMRKGEERNHSSPSYPRKSVRE